MEDGAESDASGDTVDLDSQKLDSLELDSQEPQSPESFLPDHIQLSNAAFASSADLHKLLAKHNIDIDSRDPAGYTTLMTMITHKRRDSALVLLKHGAGVLLVNSQGWSAFHLAASTGDIEVLQALVAAARRASDTALAEALVSELVDSPGLPSLRPLPHWATLPGLARGRLSPLWPLLQQAARTRTGKTPAGLATDAACKAYLEQLAPASHPPPPGSATATATAAATAHPPPPAVAAAAAATPPQPPQPQPQPASPQAAAPRTPQKTAEAASSPRSPDTEPLKTPQAAPAPAPAAGLGAASGSRAGPLGGGALGGGALGGGALLVLVLAVALYAALACLSAEPAAPGSSPNGLCTWRWDAFRCSAGCRPRVHLPLLQGVCTPM